MTKLFSILPSLLFILGSTDSRLSAQDAAKTPNLLSNGDMLDFTEQPNLWGGADALGNMRVLSSIQFAVDENGRIDRFEFSPSVAVGDLNGDGLRDLVVADPKGFIWFFPNSGTKAQLKFTTGEVMPIWLGGLAKEANQQDDDKLNIGGATDRLVPRIQLVDFDGDGKLDLVVGTYPGKLFYIHNTGSATQPVFATPKDLGQLKYIPLRSDGRLNCNYLCPFLSDWSKTGRLDLLMGDGTYSANSIYLYTNKGSNAQPIFNELNKNKVVVGFGREQLTPQVVDWNNDGKPDIITGERTGQIEVFLNTSEDPAHPTFDQGQIIKIGNQDTFGQFTTVTTANFSGNPKVPDLIISNNSGEIFLCRNTGTPGAPQFASPPEPIKATNPYPSILVSSSWCLGFYDYHDLYPFHGWADGTPCGVPYEILEVVNAQKEPDFAPPEGVTWKNALEYKLLDRKGVYFTDSYYPVLEDDTQQHGIWLNKTVTLSSETEYQISFWIKSEGVHDASLMFHGDQLLHPGTGDRTHTRVKFKKPISLGANWARVVENVSWNTTYPGREHDPTAFWFHIGFYGQGKLYLSDVEIHKL